MLTFEQRQQIRAARSKASRDRVARTEAVERVLEKGRRSCYGCGIPWDFYTPNCEDCRTRRRAFLRRDEESAPAPSG